MHCGICMSMYVCMFSMIQILFYHYVWTKINFMLSRENYDRSRMIWSASSCFMKRLNPSRGNLHYYDNWSIFGIMNKKNSKLVLIHGIYPTVHEITLSPCCLGGKQGLAQVPWASYWKGVRCLSIIMIKFAHYTSSR